WAGKLPVNLQATFARNVRGLDSFDPKAVNGYQVGAIVGAAKAAGSWEAAAFRKYAETDATVADIADSDFGDGGTNRQGYIFWVGYAPTDWMMLRAKTFITEVVDASLSPNDKAVNRLQLDANIKF